MKTFIQIVAVIILALFRFSCKAQSDTKNQDNIMSEHVNHLINEKSPYLLQHSLNPVDWYPWSKEAFELAKKMNKPIFLSIGYSTCHWCHVMERESFEDQEVADLMNDTFISIKVDREERPDIDNIYMKVTQMLTGRGGWPMTIIMTPDKKPFFAGTYFPKESKHGRIGMIELVKQVKEIWATKQDEVKRSTEQIIDGLKNLRSDNSQQTLTENIFVTAFEELSQQYDKTYGGFGNSPKFPIPHNLMYLLRYYKQSKNEEALSIVTNTLDNMSQGGIYDHIGFGFHRYSTDREWLLPHFEKMLYDQALLSMAYTEAFLATSKEKFKETALEIFTYVLRDMTSHEGGFYSAEDADSEGVEGKFYTWDINEIKTLLDPHEAQTFIEIYNLLSDGNFLDESTKAKSGLNIPHLSNELKEFTAKSGIDYEKFKKQLSVINRKLFTVREKRVHPFKDDKILTDWNGLMIAAFAKGGRAFNESNLINTAVTAAEFIMTRMKNDEGLLLHRYKEGDSAITANADDYAFMVWGLLELYEATFDSKFLAEAIKLNNTFIKHFWDDKSGGFFFTPDYGEELLVRSKEIYDGAVPSANSVALNNLIKLSLITTDTKYESYIDNTIKTFSDDVVRMPSVYSQFLSAFYLHTGESKEVIITGCRDSEDTSELLGAIRSNYFADAVVIFLPADDLNDPIYDLAPYTKSYSPINGKATAYVCRNHECNLPTTNIEEMLRQLQ